MHNNKEKKTFRLYAVLLFIGAAIVLLWTGYSQNKINENYKNSLNDKENEKSKFEYNLNSALDENKKLNDKIEKLEKDLSESYNKNDDLEKEIKSIKEKQLDLFKEYEQILKADYEYNRGNIKESALILLEINENQLSKKYVIEMYNKLKNTVNKGAAELFYYDGYKNFIDKDYINAIEYFKLSLKLTEEDYFSDDCYYYIAYSGYYMKDYKLSKEMVDILMNNYPESCYYDEAKRILKLIESVP